MYFSPSIPPYLPSEIHLPHPFAHLSRPTAGRRPTTSPHVVSRCYTPDWSTRHSLVSDPLSPPSFLAILLLPLFLIVSLGEYLNTSRSHVISSCRTFDWSPCVARSRSPPLRIHLLRSFTRLLRHTAGHRPTRHPTWFPDATPRIGRRTFARLRPALPSFIPGNPPPFPFLSRLLVSTAMLLPLT